jgi:hypothetical protein
MRRKWVSGFTLIIPYRREWNEFFREIAKPAQQGPPAPPSPEDMQRLFAVAAKYSHWMGSPEENAALG